jgi:anti-sigma regulatory factor (Ser/Thr protein kinase)
VPTRSRAVLSRPASFVEARRFVRDAAATSASRQALDDATLLTSELVTNAVRHAGHAEEEPIEVTVSVDERSLRVTVTDRGPGFDPDALDARSGEGGWGLDLVRRLSSRWGVDRGGLGTDVWFEIDLAPPAKGKGRRLPN